MSLLSVRHLKKSFGGVVAVADVSLDLAAGEMLAMIGPNGAGKSTSFNLVNGQLTPDAGSVRLFGEELVGLKPRQIWRRGVGRTFQITATFLSMTVLENIILALISYHRHLESFFAQATKMHVDEAMALIDLVEMTEQADKPCSYLAYGDLKRVELAVALSNAPRLLLMDEPTAGMSPHERNHLMDLVERVVEERNLGVLFTEHDMDVVFGHADRVIVLNRGSVIAEGPPAVVRSDERVREVYLGSEADDVASEKDLDGVSGRTP